jgi:hypothetical protein
MCQEKLKFQNVDKLFVKYLYSYKTTLFKKKDFMRKKNYDENITTIKITTNTLYTLYKDN